MFSPPVSQVTVGFEATFNLHHLTEYMGFLGVISVFVEICRRKEVFLAPLMGDLVDGTNFCFQCFDGCVGRLKRATRGVDDVPVLGTADNGSNWKFAMEAGADLTPNRKLQFGAVEVN